MERFNLEDWEPEEPFADFVARLFEFEYCDECGGDAEHHSPVVVHGLWFARCVWPPSDDGTFHPVIQAFQEEVK